MRRAAVRAECLVSWHRKEVIVMLIHGVSFTKKWMFLRWQLFSEALRIRPALFSKWWSILQGSQLAPIYILPANPRYMAHVAYISIDLVEIGFAWVISVLCSATPCMLGQCISCSMADCHWRPVCMQVQHTWRCNSVILDSCKMQLVGSPDR